MLTCLRLPEWAQFGVQHLHLTRDPSKPMRLVLVLTTYPGAPADIGLSLSSWLMGQMLTPDGATGETDTGYHVLRRLSVTTNCTEALGLSLTPFHVDRDSDTYRPLPGTMGLTGWQL